MTDVIIKMEHCRRLRYCARGVREFFARYNLDYYTFLKEGLPAKVLLASSNNDGMVLALVEVARGRKQ